MLLTEIIEKLSLKIVSGENNLNRDITCGWISDILSDVMAKASKNAIWITNQTHENVIAIVFFKGLAGVILPGGLEPEKTALEKAREKGIPVFLTELTTFDIAGELYALGIRGKK
jgi:predicted transcriptional regulator